jgi:hypothetical protein
MTPENFIYWIQGFFEIQDPKNITEQQVQIIKDHIALVLKKDTPQYTLNFIKSDSSEIYCLNQKPPLPTNPVNNIVLPFGGSC